MFAEVLSWSEFNVGQVLVKLVADSSATIYVLLLVDPHADAILAAGRKFSVSPQLYRTFQRSWF